MIITTTIKNNAITPTTAPIIGIIAIPVSTKKQIEYSSSMYAKASATWVNGRVPSACHPTKLDVAHTQKQVLHNSVVYTQT